MREFSIFSPRDETKASTLVDKASDLSMRGVRWYPSWIPIDQENRRPHYNLIEVYRTQTKFTFLVLDKLNLLSCDLTQVKNKLSFKLWTKHERRSIWKGLSHLLYTWWRLPERKDHMQRIRVFTENTLWHFLYVRS